MKKYFVYELKKTFPILCTLTIILTALYLSQVMLTSSLYFKAYNLSYISSIGSTLAVLVPAIVFRYKMKKRSIDLYYALPISHTKIIVVKFLIGLILVYVPFTVAYWIGAASVASNWYQEMATIYYIPHYFSTIIPIYLIYAISSFAYTRANRAADGIGFVILWMFAVALVMAVLSRMTSVHTLVDIAPDGYPAEIRTTVIYFINPYYYLPFAPLDCATSFFQSKLLMSDYTGYLIDTDAAGIANMAVGFTITTLMGIGSTVGLIMLEKKAKAENAQQISESWFGGKVLIPLYTVCLISFSSLMSFFAPFYIVTIVTMMFAIYASYRRTIKIGIKGAIVFGSALLLGAILAFVCNIVWTV